MILENESQNESLDRLYTQKCHHLPFYDVLKNKCRNDCQRDGFTTLVKDGFDFGILQAQK